ncbi:MAG: hypothetical protein WEB58_06840 [Planctomycetaceae bacterium]
MKARWPGVAIRRFDSLAALLKIAEGNDDSNHWFPDVGVVCQTWPDEFSRGDVLRLMSAYPLTRWICQYGPWCDSDGRNRDIWPAAFRVPDAWLDVRLDREAGVLANSLPALSATASLAEIFNFHFGPADIAAVESRRLAIVSPDRAYRISLKRLLEEGGHAVVHHDAPISVDEPTVRSLSCDALVWDCDPWIPLQRERLNQLRATTTPIVGLAGLPFPDDETDMRACGIEAVVAKLAPAEKLLAVLNTITATPAVRRS